MNQTPTRACGGKKEEARVCAPLTANAAMKPWVNPPGVPISVLILLVIWWAAHDGARPQVATPTECTTTATTTSAMMAGWGQVPDERLEVKTHWIRQWTNRCTLIMHTQNLLKKIVKFPAPTSMQSTSPFQTLRGLQSRCEASMCACHARNRTGWLGRQRGTKSDAITCLSPGCVHMLNFCVPDIQQSGTCTTYHSHHTTD